MAGRQDQTPCLQLGCGNTEGDGPVSGLADLGSFLGTRARTLLREQYVQRLGGGGVVWYPEFGEGQTLKGLECQVRRLGALGRRLVGEAGSLRGGGTDEA